MGDLIPGMRDDHRRPSAWRGVWTFAALVAFAAIGWLLAWAVTR